MARIFIDGFEGGNLDLWERFGSSDVSPSGALTGNYSNLVEYYFNSESYLKKALDSNFTTLGLGMNVKVSSAFAYSPSPFVFIRFFCGVTNVISLSIYFRSTYRKYRILKGPGEVVNTFQYNTIDPEAKFNLQLKVTNLTPGDYTYQVLQDDVEMLNGGFQLSSFSYLDYFSIGCFNNAGESCRFDDIVVDDVELPGSSEIYGLIPFANGTTNQWESTDSTNFQSIDEIPRDDVDYIHTDVFDEIDLYQLTNLPAGVGEVKSLLIWGHSQQTAGPPPTEHTRLVARTDSTNFLGAVEDIHVASDFGKTTQLLQVSPSSREAWTEAKINDLEIGIKLVG